MDERPEPKRIEIELTSHEPLRGSRPAESDGDGDATGASAVGLLETERGRLIAVAAFIGVLALLIGVLVGRAGSGGDVATADSATTTTTDGPRPATTVSGDAEPLPTVRTIDTPPPTAPSPTPRPVPTAPSVDQVEPRKGVIDVAPELADLGVEIIGQTISGDVIVVDPVTGSTVTYEVGRSFGPPLIFAGPDWILVPTVTFGDQPGAVVLAGDGTRTFIDTAGSWPFSVSDAESGRFWLQQVSASAASPGMRLVEMSISGEATGTEVVFTTYPRLIDPLGGFVVDAPGGSYRVTAEGPTRLSTGRVLGVGRTRVFVEECDEFLECGHFVVDRTTGTRQRIELDETLRRGLEFDMMVSPSREAFNQAEDALLVAFWDALGDGGHRIGVLDLETGAFAEFSEFDVYDNGGLNVSWGPDGEHVFWLDSTGHLQVLDPDTGESVRFSDDLGQLNGFALRPAASLDVG